MNKVSLEILHESKSSVKEHFKTWKILINKLFIYHIKNRTLHIKRPQNTEKVIDFQCLRNLRNYSDSKVRPPK